MTAPELPENAYRARAERGEVQIGTWITMIRTPSVLTLLQAAGLDYARLDLEHSAFSIETVADMAALARALNFPLVVRPPEGNREWITRLLDAGVWNLHIPQVETAEQAAEVVAATRYMPLGSRGMYGSGPHTGHRVRPPAEHMATANARVHVTAMLEASTLRPPRRDRGAGHRPLTIGPTDLSQDLGVLGTPSQSKVLREHRVRLGEAARKHGKTIAMAVDTIEAVREVIALGATIVNYSSDTNVLRSTYAAAVAEIRKPKERS
jgi:2-keto-3-deoxy-L-rhamnonate aldolase RhmA